MADRLSHGDITRYLRRIEAGDRSAVEDLLPHIYADLKSIADGVFRGQPGSTLQPTVLVHDAYLRLVGSESGWVDRAHFFRVAAMAMRQLLTDHARKRRTTKRGGDHERVELDPEIATDENPGSIDAIALDDVLTKLEALDERQARIVEMRFLAGLTVEEIATALKVSERSIYKRWKLARAWLFRELRERPVG